MHQIKTFLYALAFSIACTAFFMQYIAVDAHALSADYTIKLCERNFIGTEYKPYLHNKCELIWQHLTFQILNNQ